MPLNLSPTNLLDSEIVSKFIFGVDDVTAGTLLTPQQRVAVELCLDAVSAQIQRYTGFTFKKGNYVEVWDSASSDELIPTEIPVTAITSVKFSSNGQFDDVPPIDSSLYSISNRGLAINFRGEVFAPRGRGVIQVAYTAGYDPIPSDIQLAALRQFQYLYKQVGKGDAMVGLKMISKMNESQTKDDSIAKSGLISEVEGMLKSYCRFETAHSIMFTRVY